jgi:uncharacterized protein (DUF1697 family)
VRTFVALLRGVNVGGNNMISMSELAECVKGLGFSDVRTYINSGNVVFRARARNPRKLEQDIEAAIERRFSAGIRVLVRDLDQMRALVDDIRRTWTQEDTDERRNVMFLAHEIDSEDLLEQLNPKPEIEAVSYRPGALLWSASRRHLTRSEMVKLNRMKIFQAMTIRNPNTTLRLYELMSEAESG